MGIVVNGTNWVDNKPIREAVEQAEREGMSASEIALRLGWTSGYRRRHGRQADTSRLGRRLGRTANSDGHCSFSQALRYDIAVAIIRAVDREPHEFDL